MGVDKAGDAIFQPTLPVRGVTRSCSAATGTSRISTHTPRAGSDGELQRPPVRVQISTHTPRAGSDRVVGLEEVS